MRMLKPFKWLLFILLGLILAVVAGTAFTDKLRTMPIIGTVIEFLSPSKKA